VMLALITGAVFAQTSVSGGVETRFTVLQGTSDDELKDLRTQATVNAAHVQLTGRNEAGTIGALARVRQADTGYHRAFIWWRPVPELRIFLGRDDDGMFSTGNALTDWQFHQGGEGYVSIHNWALWRAVFPGNWDKPGLAFSYYGVEGLELNLVIPAESSSTIEAMYPAGLHLMGSYRIPDIGTVLFSYYGEPKTLEDITEGNEKATFGNTGISFLLTAVPGLRTQIGVSTFPALKGPTPPIRIGWGLNWASGNFGVKARAAYFIRGATGTDNQRGYEQDTPDRFIGNIMPYYTMGNVSIFCDIGIDNNRTGDDVLDWWVNPYIRYANFRAGVLVQGNNTDGAPVTFRVPILAAFGF